MPQPSKKDYERLIDELTNKGYRVVSQNAKYVTMRPHRPTPNSNPQSDTIIFPKTDPMPPDYYSIIERKTQSR